MSIEANDSTARVIKERVGLSRYREMVEANADAKARSNGRIWVLMDSILREIDLSGSPSAATIQAAREAMAAHDAVDAQSWYLVMECDVVPDGLEQIEMTLDGVA